MTQPTSPLTTEIQSLRDAYAAFSRTQSRSTPAVGDLL